MRKNIISLVFLRRLFWLLLPLCGLGVACSDMNELGDRFLDREETLYAEKVDSAVAYTGFKRIEIQVRIKSQRVDFVRVYYTKNARADSSDIQVGNRSGMFSGIIEDMPESEYLFRLVSFDKYGNRSLPYELSGKVIGDTYSSGLRIQPVESYAGNGGWYIFLGAAGDNAVVTEIEYSEADGTAKTVSIPVSVRDTVILGTKPHAAFKYRTFYGGNFIEPVPSNYEESDGSLPAIRPVTVATKFGNGYAVALGTVERNTYSEFLYRNTQGNDVSVRVPAGEQAAYLYDADGSGFSQVACYVSNPLDTFRSVKTPYAGTVGDVSVTITSSAPAILKPGDFDLGGEGVGFHDSDANHSGANGVNYRPNLGDYLSNAMDIEAVAGNIGTTNAGEWLIYTINVRDEGDYETDWYISVNGNAASCHVEIDGVASSVYPMVNNSNWTDWRYYCERNSVSPPVFHLTAGRHILKYVFDGGGYNYNGLRIQYKP